MKLRLINLFRVWKFSGYHLKQRRFRNNRTTVGIFLTVFFITIFYLIHLKIIWKYDPAKSLVQIRIRVPELPIEDEKGTGCEFPKLDPFAKGFLKHTHNISRLVCEGEDWVDCYHSECFILPEVLDKMDNVTCEFRDIMYVTDKWFYLDDPVTMINKKYVLYYSDFVKVQCTGFFKNSPKLSKWTGYKAGLRHIPKYKSDLGREKTPNVLILCLNSMSHNGFIRSMPNSLRVLKEEMDAVIFNRFNVVGGHAPSNLSPLLTGMASSEHKHDERMFFGDHVNHTKFLFYVLKQDGYRTAFYKDRPWLGTFFPFHKGFDEQPADHNLCAFFMQYHADNLKSKGNDYCVGNIPHYSIMLNLTKQFFKLDGKKFSFTFISDISNDKFNMKSTIDDDVASFLRWIKVGSILENTMIVVMGDHGLRFGPQRRTKQGILEERMPFLSIILPETLKKSRPVAVEYLKANSKDVLTTAYDVHATVLDIVSLLVYRNEFVVPGSNWLRGLSLLKPIVKTRSCAEADVSPYWCVCSVWKSISKTEPMSLRIGNLLAERVNDAFKILPTNCVKRKLLTILWVKKRVSKHVLYRNKKEGDLPTPLFEYYKVQVVMHPKMAVYEAAVNYNVKKDLLTIYDGDISRIDTYGEEANCVARGHPQLREFCFCKDNLLYN